MVLVGRLGDALMRRLHYVPLRRGHDIPIRRREDIPLRRHWVFHLRRTCDVAGTYKETSLRRCHDVFLPGGKESSILYFRSQNETDGLAT